MTDVLIVEDEEALAMVLATALEDAGYAVVGTADSVHTALQALSDRHVDLALLDVNLGRQKVFAVSDRLAAMGNPVHLRDRLLDGVIAGGAPRTPAAEQAT